MATRSWTALGTAGDWGDTDNWSGTTLPVNGDTIVIATSADDIATNLPGTPLTGVTLKIGPGFTGTIGTSSTHLDLDGSNIDFASGGGDCYLTGVWTTVTVSGGASTLYFANGGTTDIGTIRIVDGSETVVIGDGSVLDIAIVTSPSASLTIEENTTSLDDLTVTDGIVTCEANQNGTTTVRGGRVTISGSAVTTALTIYDGRVDYTSSGTITTLTMYGGHFDGTDNGNPTVTITDATLHEGGRADLRSGIRNWTIINPVAMEGGVLLPPHGTTLTVA